MDKKNSYLIYLAYLSILFVIPERLQKDSSFAMFHVEQGKKLFTYQLVLIVLNLLLKTITCLNFPVAILVGLGFVLSVGWIMYFTFIVFGVLNIIKGFEKKLPIIGNLK